MLRTVERTFLSSRLSKIFIGVTWALLSSACFTSNVHPNVDLVLAREAFNAANEVEAAKYAPANFHKAEESYRQGMAQYQEHSYEEAINSFRLARIYSEKAETTARILRQKAGEEGL